MKQKILFIILFCLSTSIQAQNRQRFDGGMMVHTGYMQGHFSVLDYDAQGLALLGCKMVKIKPNYRTVT